MTLTNWLNVIGFFAQPMIGGGMSLTSLQDISFELQHPKLAAIADDPITAIINLIKKKLPILPHGKITLCQRGD